MMNNLFSKLGGDWATFTVKPKHFHDVGNVVAVEGRYVGEHAGSGKSLDCQFCHVWTFESGKVTKFQQYCDTAQIQETMGVHSR